jgi:putative flippase GtrA
VAASESSARLSVAAPPFSRFGETNGRRIAKIVAVWSAAMIPPTFIFDETQETIAARANQAHGLLAFLAIGAGAAALYIVLTQVFLPAFPGTEAWVVSTLCYAALVIPTYLLHRRYAFQSDAAHAYALPRYVAVQILALGFMTLFSFVAYGVAEMPHLPAAVLVIGLTAGVNFAVLRLWAFASR